MIASRTNNFFLTDKKWRTSGRLVFRSVHLIKQNWDALYIYPDTSPFFCGAGRGAGGGGGADSLLAVGSFLVVTRLAVSHIGPT